jgi:hypothetical protein
MFSWQLDAERPKFFQSRQQMLRGACESVKAPHYDCVKLALPGVCLRVSILPPEATQYWLTPLVLQV